MKVSYQVHQLDGYTDGKPSWARVFVGRGLHSIEDARKAAEELQFMYPKQKFRARTIKRK